MVLKIIEWYRVGIIVFILEHKSRGASHRVGGNRLGEYSLHFRLGMEEEICIVLLICTVVHSVGALVGNR